MNGAESPTLAKVSLVLLMLFAVVACASGDPQRRDTTEGPASSVPTSLPTPSPSPPPKASGGAITKVGPAAGSRPVVLTAADGVRLGGRVFGSGRSWVVLSHMGRPGDDQTQWFPLASSLARAGFTVLTYNRRGVCIDVGSGCSEGADVLADTWQDVLGAYRYASARGDHVALVGASIGAMASLAAAAQPQVKADAVVFIAGILNGSGYDSASNVRRVHAPMMFVSGENDGYGAAAVARQLYTSAPGTKELQIVDSPLHGAEMYQPDQPTFQPLVTRLAAFVTRHR